VSWVSVDEGSPVPVSAHTQVTDLTLHDHACLTFGEQEELLDLTAAFVRDGLASGCRVVVLSDAPQVGLATLGGHELAADAAVTAGQVVVVASADGLVGPSGFSAKRAVGWLRGQLADARRQGYAGIRVALDMSWALQPMTGIEELPVLEEEIAAMVAAAEMSVMCGYDRERFDPVTLALIAPMHSQAVATATYLDDPVLRICRQYVPPGVRLAGELDFLARESLALALGEAIRIDGDITINMNQLSFIDAASTRMILDAAASLGPSRAVALRCQPPVEARFAQLGGDLLPHIILVGGHDK
jgi:anti-anti-sigma regulatory factor